MNSEQYKALTIREFDTAAAGFDNDDPSVYNMCRKDYPDILKEVKKEEFTKLLDAGCGTGAMLKLFAKDIPDKEYYGIDLSSKMIEVAKQNTEGIHLMQGDCEELPYPDETFDVITCSMSFHHYPNVSKFFYNANRILKPNGRLILRDVTIRNPLILWLFNHIEIPLLNRFFQKGDVKCYSKNDVQQLCDESNLILERFEIRKGMRLHAVIRKKTETL